MGTSTRLCASATGALLQGEEAVAACLGRATRPRGSYGKSGRIPTDQDVVVMITSHRVLVFKTGYGGNVGRPLYGVGPHNLRRVDVSRHAALTGRITIEFMDSSTTIVDMATLGQVGRMKDAADQLLAVSV